MRRYFCLKGPDQGGCGRLTVVAEPVEQLVTDAVLVRPDSRYLADAMAARTSVDHDIADLASQLDADQGRLDELAGLYADGAISAREWITARDPITTRIQQTRDGSPRPPTRQPSTTSPAPATHSTSIGVL